MSSSVKATAGPTARAAAAPRARGRMPVEKELRKVRQKQVQRLNAVAKAVGIKAISDGAAKPLVQALVDGENKNTAKKTCWRENFTELLANRRAGTISAISAGGERRAELQTGRGKNKNTAEKTC